MSTLTILGAAYGTSDVTAKVQKMVNNGVLIVTANNTTFGDPWVGVHKSLVLVYRYGGHPAEVRIVQEGSNVTINEPSTSLQSNVAAGLPIYGAAYGLAVVTPQVQQLVTGGSLNVTANNATFGDSWPGVNKSLVVVYEQDGKPMLMAVKENEALRIQTDITLKLLTAAYGPANVTDKVRAGIKNQEIHLTANNTTFGDSWVGVKKTLVATYQYGNEQPQLAIIQEGDALNVTYTPHRPFQPSVDPKHLQILSAAYGIGDVTARAVGLVHDNALSVTANNETFQDTWRGVQKTLVVTYQIGQQTPAVTTAKEGQQLQIQQTVLA